MGDINTNISIFLILTLPIFESTFYNLSSGPYNEIAGHVTSIVDSTCPYGEVRFKP